MYDSGSRRVSKVSWYKLPRYTQYREGVTSNNKAVAASLPARELFATYTLAIGVYNVTINVTSDSAWGWRMHYIYR